MRLDSVGGDHCLFLPLVHISSFNVITVLVEFAPDNISLIRLSHSLLHRLSTFDLLKKVDENGQEIQPKIEYRGGAAQ